MRIETTRLVIRSFQPDDIDAYAAIVADPAVTRHLDDGHPHSVEEARAYVEDVLARDLRSGISRYAVTLKRDATFVGFCGFKSLDDYTDFGWRYARTAWGDGIGTEAALAVRDHGLELGLTNMSAKTYLANEASHRIIAKLGFPRSERLTIRGRPAIRYHQR